MAKLSKLPLSFTNQSGIFTHLQSLVGKWHGINEEGHPVWVDYEMTAHDTVLVEHWVFHNHVEALTLYHMDEDKLIATHYCPVGNQPRLDFLSVSADGVIEFEFVSATNLPDPDVDHAQHFDLKILSADTMRRNETYVEKGIAETNGTTFSRIKR